ncbi:MAG TPA: PP2C family protein-serine/threonine phosphatase [Candidatus Acidoferrales bacterium]|nr:PP2C family protein-serine/threonine phosphatase [Candidatus Acidoferrales bacterium]
MTPNVSMIKSPAIKTRGGSPIISGEQEWEAARSVQERIFPTVRPAIPGLDYYGDWRPAGGVSGDYIDYFVMSAGNLGLAVGDVSAKGLPAAMLTSSLHSTIRALRFTHNSDLPELVRSIHELFYEICPDNCYATLFVARFDPMEQRLHYVNAGHEPPFVLRKNGGHYRTIFLEPGGPMIGMVRKSCYREGMVSVNPGDLMVAYTDGLCETRNQRGEEWGWPRFLEKVESCAESRARDIVDAVMQETEMFAAGATQYDDVTLWVGKMEDAVADEPLWEAECVEVAA